MRNSFQIGSGKAAIVAALVLAAGQASAAELIQNGGFEADGVTTYAPSGWTVTETMATGGVMADNTTLSPAGYATTGAASGSYYGVLESFAPGAYILTQSFSTSAVSSANLSFKMFVNDNSAEGVTYVSTNLDVEAANNLGSLINYARVDVLKAGAAASATDSDVLASFYIGGATGRAYDTTSNKYVSYSFDLSSLLAQGGDYTLRFAVASNAGSVVMGIDDVSLNVAAVPEPETYAMLLAGLGLIGAVARRRAV